MRDAESVLFVKGAYEILNYLANVQKDFFISYASEDREWAERIRECLKELGYKVVYDQDFPRGHNFRSAINNAILTARCTIALYSKNSLKKDYTTIEWDSVLASDPHGQREDRFWPIRIEECSPGGLLSSLAYTDLINCGEVEVKARVKNDAENKLTPLKECKSQPSSAVKPTVLAYCRWIVRHSEFLSLTKLNFDGVGASKLKELMRIPRLYVDGRLASSDSAGTFIDSASLASRLCDNQAATEPSADSLRVVLLGGIGSGKSTFLQCLAYSLASEVLEGRGLILPVMVGLRSFSCWLSENGQSRADSEVFWNYLVHMLRASLLGDAEEDLWAAFSNGRAIVLLDGLDEVSRAQRACVCEIINQCNLRFGGCRFLMASRPLPADLITAPLLEGWQRYELLPFEKSIDLFLGVLYRIIFASPLASSTEIESRIIFSPIA